VLDASCVAHLDLRVTRRHHPHLAHRPDAFWLCAVAFVILLFGVTLPTPLYVVYQAKWGFTSGVLTAVFAIYAAGVLTALLVFGRLSDQIGRKAVLFAAVGVAAASTIVFFLADGVASLFIARLLSGFAAGLTQGTATAALAELEPHHDQRRAALVGSTVSTGAAGIGPLLAGILVEYAGWTTHLVFVVYLVCLVGATVAMLLLPETVVERHRPSLHFQRPSVPGDIRTAFVTAAASCFAVSALLGLFISLVPSFLGNVLHQRNHAVAGAIVSMLFAVATTAQLLLHRLKTRHALLSGFAGLVVGLGLVMLGLDIEDLATFIAGTVCTGIGVGLVMMGSIATINAVAPPEHRGEIMSGFFVSVYAGLAIPALGVGIASQHVGFFQATLVCAIALAVLVGVVAIGIFRSRPAPAPAPA
jgi:MFS family permease